MSIKTEPNIEKLPKWAQEHIANLKRERDAAVKTLQEFTDDQTPSRVSFTEAPCIGGDSPGPTFLKRYIQTNNIEVEYAGVRVNVYTCYGDHICIRYGDIERDMRPIALVPASYQTIELYAKKNMR